MALKAPLDGNTSSQVYLLASTAVVSLTVTTGSAEMPLAKCQVICGGFCFPNVVIVLFF